MCSDEHIEDYRVKGCIKMPHREKIKMDVEVDDHTILCVLDRKHLHYLKGKTIKKAKIERVSDKYIDEVVEHTEFYDRLIIEFIDGSKLVIKSRSTTENSSGIEIDYTRKRK